MQDRTEHGKRLATLARSHGVLTALFLASCATDLGGAPTREPLVDPESGRVEEVPETELEVGPLRAPDLTGHPLAAAQRHTERLQRIGERVVRRRGRDVREAAFARLGASELAAHFSDAQTASGRQRGELVRTHLASARAVAADTRAPTATQEEALAGIELRAMTDVRVDWDEGRGSPRRIAGALHVTRGAPVDVGTGWVDHEWPALADALGADEYDAIERVHVGELPDNVTAIAYRRLRSGVAMPENLLEVHVTTEEHPVGQGLVLRVEAQWDTDVASGATPLDELGEARALALAQEALGAVFAESDAANELTWRCYPAEGAACRPTWRVQWRRAEEDSSGADTVYLDARSGLILDVARDTHDYDGRVRQTTNYPGDSADVLRDMRFAELRQWTGSTYLYSSTDSDGEYSWSPPTINGQVGLHSRPGTTIMEARHTASAQCASPTPDYDWRNFNLATGASFVIAPDPTTHRRGDWLMFHYLNYAMDMYWDFSNIEEMPKILWFNAAGGGSQFAPCDGPTEVGALTVNAGVNDTSTAVLRDLFWEELHHSTEWCIQTVGPGCGYTMSNPRSFASGWGHAYGGAIGSYVNDYETNVRGMGTSSPLRYAGPAVPGDLFLHDSEIEGTPTSGINGCNPNVMGAYNCAADEACFGGGSIAAMDGRGA